MEFDLENQPTSFDDEPQGWASISKLFTTEANQMISAVGAIDLCARRDAVSLILQAQSDRDLEPFVAYLAISYVDRYLSKREIPKEKPWIIRLLSISCLSLASKMKTDGIAIADFQKEERFIFDSQTIRRMELLVLGTLDWRMRSITPFSFLRFFISFFSLPQPPLLQILKAHATQILLKVQHGNNLAIKFSPCKIDFLFKLWRGFSIFTEEFVKNLIKNAEVKMLEFKPSVVAASALLSAAYEFFPVQFSAFRAALASCEFVNKEKLLECSSAMGVPAATDDVCDVSAAAGTVSSSNTPVTVLGRLCSSSESEPTAGSSSDGVDVKKRRMTCDHNF